MGLTLKWTLDRLFKLNSIMHSKAKKALHPNYRENLGVYGCLTSDIYIRQPHVYAIAKELISRAESDLGVQEGTGMVEGSDNENGQAGTDDEGSREHAAQMKQSACAAYVQKLRQEYAPELRSMGVSLHWTANRLCQLNSVMHMKLKRAIGPNYREELGIQDDIIPGISTGYKDVYRIARSLASMADNDFGIEEEEVDRRQDSDEEDSDQGDDAEGPSGEGQSSAP